MCILRFTYCLLQGHAYIDVTATPQPYRYCLHCGKVHEQATVPMKRRLFGRKYQVVSA
jgi:hypothetical protein